LIILKLSSKIINKNIFMQITASVRSGLVQLVIITNFTPLSSISMAIVFRLKS
jgi:hypothetical protein